MNSETTRRSVLTALTLSTAAVGLGSGSRLEAAGMSAGERVNVDIVNGFCSAWPGHDVPRIMSFFAENCAYRMTETMKPNEGRDAVTSRITSLAPTVERFEVLDTWAKGPMVFNERVDHFSSGQLKSWHGVGVFFLKDGKIVEWYDYTIAMERR